MRDLHESVKHTAKEMVIKESEGFRLRMEKWESINPKGLYAIDLIQESLDEDGDVQYTSTYNFNMTKEELQSLAYGLTL
jgi:trehalose/maltose hydrolase-like predicted phosphorylase